MSDAPLPFSLAELDDGVGQWRNISPVIRSTVRWLLNMLNAQGAALREQRAAVAAPPPAAAARLCTEVRVACSWIHSEGIVVVGRWQWWRGAPC